MSTKHLAVCPRCHEFYSTEKYPSSVKCEECGSVLQLVAHGYDLYSTLSDEEKTAFKRKYIEDHFPGSKPYQKPFSPMPQSGWVSYIGCCGWLSLVVCMIGCVISFMSGGILYAVILALAGALSCGVLILFSIVAEDVRHIRNQVDRYYHEQGKP